VSGVHQFVPALIPRDATGSHTLLLRQALRAAGWRSEIYAEATHDELSGQAVYYERYRPEPGDVLVYQFSTSSAMGEHLLSRDEPLVLDYHNVTRPELTAAWDPEPTRRSAEALEQLGRLAPRAALGLADSAYNEADLTAAGCARTAVVPVLVDLERLVAPADPGVVSRLATVRRGGGADWLFVGRVVPSKGQHDLVKALWAYRRLYDPDARLHLVGPTPSPRYLSALRAFGADLGLQDAVRITGEVSDAALGAYYAVADVFVSASSHEGFGVPILEAMWTGVPVVALGAAAVPETVGDAGLVVDRPGAAVMAAAVHRVLSDAGLRARLAANGRRRASSHTLAESGRRTVAAIRPVVEEAACA
jgi:L-malate glycosyltransferase